MGVALGAGRGQAEPGCACGAHPIDHRQIPKLKRVDAAFLVDHRVAMEAGGDDVIDRRFRQHVAGDLPNRKRVEGHVVVERPDHPVAVGPDLAGPILLVAVGIGIAGKIQPAAGPPLTIPGAGKQPINEPLIGVFRSVRQKGLELLRRRRQAHEIERHPPAERRPVCLARRREPLGLEPRKHKAVDGVLHPGIILHCWRLRPLRWLKRPVRGIRRARRDPLCEDPLLMIAEHDLCVGRGHHKIRIGARDSRDHLALVDIAGHNRSCATVEFGNGGLTQIESEPRFLVLVVWPVALETAVGKHRPHVPVEVGGRAALWACRVCRHHTDCQHQHRRQPPRPAAQCGLACFSAQIPSLHRCLSPAAKPNYGTLPSG